MNKITTFTANQAIIVDGIRHRFTVAVSGTFGGGTLRVRYSTNIAGTQFANYVSGETGAFTAAGEREFALCGASTNIQIELTGATNPNIICILKELDR